MAILKGAYAWRLQDLTEAMIDQVVQSGSTTIGLELSVQVYLQNTLMTVLPSGGTVPYGDHVRQVVQWIKAKGLKLLIYPAVPYTNHWNTSGRVIAYEPDQTNWITTCTQVCQELQPDAMSILNEAPDATLAGIPSGDLTISKYVSFATRMIDSLRTVKPDLNVHLTSMPFWDMSSIAANPVPRPNVTYAYHIYFMKQSGISVEAYQTAYDLASTLAALAAARASLETYIFQTQHVQNAINSGLPLSFIFGADYRTPSYSFNNWDQWLKDMYDICKVRNLTCVFQAGYATESYPAIGGSPAGVYPSGMWNGPLTTLNPVGQIWLQQMPYVPITPVNHTLVVTSTPIQGVAVTVDGYQYSTPTSPLNLQEGLHTITAPSNVLSGVDTYNFVQWEDGSTNPTRTLNLTVNATITCTYQLQAPPPPAKGSIEIHAFLDSQELVVPYEVVGVSTGNTPATVQLNVGSYTVKVTYQTQTKTQVAQVTDGQTVRLDFQFSVPPTQAGFPLWVIPIVLIGIGATYIATRKK